MRVRIIGGRVVGGTKLDEAATTDVVPEAVTRDEPT